MDMKNRMVKTCICIFMISYTVTSRNWNSRSIYWIPSLLCKKSTCTILIMPS
ncbi:unnamed protein product [Larinioides sclopetarius]|uniref:Uncharacterized protein n=1 Tax=Larinioides sclopetarius TaxID=280406 RepID=A0AAV1YPZ8_9ARAC